MKATSRYVFFYRGKLSIFSPCTVKMTIDGEEMTFGSSEQAFMYMKAREFGDEEQMAHLANPKLPAFRAKDYGRKVKGYDETRWREVRTERMYEALKAKYTQNAGHADELLKPEYLGKHFVEASPTDIVWGIGMSEYEEDKYLTDESKWRGQNLLGKTLDRVRKELLEKRSAPKIISHEEMERMRDVARDEEWLLGAQEKLKQAGTLIDVRHMDDRQIVSALLDRDELVTADFFFHKCRPLLTDIIGYVFQGRHVDYDEVVAELYYYLMRPSQKGGDAATLQTFSFRSSLYHWIKFVAITFMQRNKRRILSRGDFEVELPQTEAFNGLDEMAMRDDDGDAAQSSWCTTDVEIRRQEAADMVENIFNAMTRGRRGRALQGAQNYVKVLRMKYLDGLDDDEAARALNIRTDNFYMLKGRVVKAFRSAAITDGGLTL